MENKYPSNSHASKEKERKENLPAEKKVEKIVSGKAVVKKKGLAKKFTDIFVAEDAHSVGEFILQDVIVPAAKALFVEIICGGANMVAYGDRGASGRRSNAERYGYRSGHTNYNSISSRRDSRPVLRNEPAYSYDDISLESRGEAEAVIDRMFELLEEYGTVSVSDLYDLVGITGNYTDCKYGWTDLRSASVVRGRDGYLLKLPRAIAL